MTTPSLYAAAALLAWTPSLLAAEEGGGLEQRWKITAGIIAILAGVLGLYFTYRRAGKARFESKHIRLEPDHWHEAPGRIKRSTYLAVRVNLLAFAIIGTISLTRDVKNLILGADVSVPAVALFFLLSPLWIGGAHFALRLAWGGVPTASTSIWLSAKVCLLSLLVLFIVAVSAYLGGPSQSLSGVLPSVLFVAGLPLAYCCFLCFGLLNGYFGVLFSAYNTTLLILKLQVGERVDPFLWFNLLGLVSLDSALFQWAMLGVTIVLGLAERTFHFLQD